MVWGLRFKVRALKVMRAIVGWPSEPGYGQNGGDEDEKNAIISKGTK